MFSIHTSRRSLYAVLALSLALGAGAAHAQRAALTQSVDEPGRNPYQEVQSAACSSVTLCLVNFPAVPLGRRAVIEHLTCNTLTLPAQAGGYLLSVGGSTFREYVQGSFQPTNGVALNGINQQVLSFFEAGQVPTVSFAVNGGPGYIQMTCKLSGYSIAIN